MPRTQRLSSQAFAQLFCSPHLERAPRCSRCQTLAGPEALSHRGLPAKSAVTKPGKKQCGEMLPITYLADAGAKMACHC